MNLQNFALILFLALASTSHADTCPNISGKFNSPFDQDTNKTTIIIAQEGCKSLSIQGSWTSEHPPYAKVYDVVSFSLDGTPPDQMSCLNSVPDMCVAYSIRNSILIKKMDPRFPTGVISDPTHGTCVYSESSLTKDKSGNLVEIPFADSCDDGFKGPLKSSWVYPAAK